MVMHPDLGDLNYRDFFGFLFMLFLLGLIGSFYVVRLFHQCVLSYAPEELKSDYEDEESIQDLVERNIDFQSRSSRIYFPSGA